jgi:hypothetical protein
MDINAHGCNSNVKSFNESNLSARMAIAKEILDHNKKIGVPMKVELGWKRFVIVPIPVPEKKDII